MRGRNFMYAKQDGSLIWLSAPLGFDMDNGKIVLSLRQARELRDALVGLNYVIEPEGGNDEDG
jgi:hypothetical protein